MIDFNIVCRIKERKSAGFILKIKLEKSSPDATSSSTARDGVSLGKLLYFSPDSVSLTGRMKTARYLTQMLLLSKSALVPRTGT